MSQTILPGTAGPGDVLTGKSFSAGTNYGASGYMPNNGAVTITPGASAQSIPAGYHNGSGSVPAVTFDATKVLTGTTIAGTAGTMPNKGAPTLNPGSSIAAGYYSGGSVANAPHGSQSFSANGTFTVPANVTQILVAICGGGGSGAVFSGSSIAFFHGGNSGSTVFSVLNVTPGQTFSVSLGTGGAGVTTSSGGVSGNNGTSSSFGTTITASGGQAGAYGSGGNSSNAASTSPAGSLVSFSYGSGCESGGYSADGGQSFFTNDNYGNGSPTGSASSGTATSSAGQNGYCEVWW